MRCGYYKDMIEKLKKLEEQHPGGYLHEGELNQIFDHEVYGMFHGCHKLDVPTKISHWESLPQNTTPMIK